MDITECLIEKCYASPHIFDISMYDEVVALWRRPSLAEDVYQHLYNKIKDRTTFLVVDFSLEYFEYASQRETYF